MKKIAVLLVGLVFLAAAAVQALTQLEKDQKAMAKLNSDIAALNQKIVQAKKDGYKKKAASLTVERDKLLSKAKALSDEIATLQSKSVTVVPVAQSSRGWLVDGGYAAGAGLIKVGYQLPVKDNFDVALNAGYGIGSGFSFVDVDVNGRMHFGNNFAGLELGLDNFSKTIKGVPGVSGNINAGNNTGFGLFVGTNIKKFMVRVGYNTVLGLNAGVTYKF
jgi:hypothetical protein